MRNILVLAAAISLTCLVWLSPNRDRTPTVASPPPGISPAVPLAVCFAEGTDPDYMNEWRNRLLDRVGALDYNVGTRWQNTAHGNAGNQGMGVTLTYSFVPDGVSIEGQGSVLFSRMNQLFGTPEEWQALYAQVFARWSEVTGNTYEQVSDDGAAFTNGNAGVIGVRGDIRIGMIEMDGANGVLAYNYFPDRGDMVLDAAEGWNSPANDRRFFRNIVAHEHGHGLGIEHVCPINTTKLMEPTYTSAFDGPQHDDILAGQRQYGDVYEPNDDASEAHVLGLIEGIRDVDFASLDDDTDVDWWEFTILNGRSLTITLIPDGAEYLEGEQNNDGSCEAGTLYNTLDNQNLNLALLNTSGVELMVANTRPVAETEQIFRYDVPQGTTTLRLRVDGATNNAIQAYRLQIESVDPATPYLLGCPLHIDTTLQGIPMDGALLLVNPPHGGELLVDSIWAAGPFTVSPAGQSLLEPSGELTITVTFSGEPLGLQTGQLFVSHNGPGGDLVCELSAFAETSSLLLMTSNPANFGEVQIGTVDSALVGIRSEGNVPLIISSVTTQAPFAVTFNGPVSLQPGPLFRLYPRVTPTMLGEQHGWLIIQHSAASSPDSVELVVTGTPNLDADEETLPREFALHQNFPNPFNATTNIAFDLPKNSGVTLQLFDLQGRLARELLANAQLAAGSHRAPLDANGLATGLYVYRLSAEGFRAERKLLLLK